ncbi:hypothetical protein [Paenibacillus tianjinensis]|uniref:Uncharacterized protein n=1 Tax=Paenibacillus tianjinensis TaxID=2810347 RepID=A0ABX7LEK5_9BACL|nr:hypothetical protein [Paenibacillus tianjinensis]QSF45284.1 hypothetical protein JRJ22_00975 [Paenibacillus tianjinensis]
MIVSVVLGAFIGGLIGTRNSDQKQVAISVMSQIAENTGSAKYKAATEIGRQEMQNDKMTGYGIGGIIGGVVGMIFIVLSRKQ